jgi:hypothetical protein
MFIVIVILPTPKSFFPLSFIIIIIISIIIINNIGHRHQQIPYCLPQLATQFSVHKLATQCFVHRQIEYINVHLRITSRDWSRAEQRP